MNIDEGVLLHLSNNLGSIISLVNSSGTTQNTYTYDPFGNSLGATEKVSNPWHFASGYFDSFTGLYKFGTRYYSAILGRWTQQDPVGGSVGNPNSGNAYVYANDDPVNLVDPTGRDAIDCILAVAVIVGLAVTIVSLLGLALFADPPLTATLAFFAYLGIGAATLAFIAGTIITLRSGVCSG